MCILCNELEWTWNKVSDITRSNSEENKAFENLCFIHKDMAMMAVGNMK